MPCAQRLKQSRLKAERSPVADLSGSIRELDTQAEIAVLKQQIASEQLKTVLAQLELGNGSGSGPGSTPPH